MPPLNYDPEAITRHIKKIQVRVSQRDLDMIEIIRDRLNYSFFKTSDVVRAAIAYFAELDPTHFDATIEAIRCRRRTDREPVADPTPITGEPLAKFEIRRRDGFRCVDCGLHSEEHRLEYGRGLSVHRLIPGGDYSPENCVTVCVPCHSERHRQMGEAAPEFDPK